MTRVTSARDRSKGKAKKPVTTSRGRSNRASVSQARVSSSANRPSGGTARVTQGRGGRPDGRQPRAITNGNSPGMRQLRAKAVQSRRQSQGRSTAASRNPGITPDSPRGARIRSQAQRLRVAGDSGRVRAAQAAGRQATATAQARRGARAASRTMEGTLRAARGARAVVGGLRNLARGGAFAEGIQARNTGDGTLSAAIKRGDYKPNQKPTRQEQSYRAKEAAASTARAKAQQATRDKSSFDAAFRSARKGKAKVFTWRGKKYTTEVK